MAKKAAITKAVVVWPEGKELKDEIVEYIKKEYPTLDSGIEGVHYGDKKKEKVKEEAIAYADNLWKEKFGLPFVRDSYKHYGHEDDAMIVTQELYDNLLKEYEGTEDGEHNADLEYDSFSPDFVGKKWVVVVDYHN